MLNWGVSWSPHRACLSSCLLLLIVASGLVLASGGVGVSAAVDSGGNVNIATVSGGNANVTTNTTTPPHENPETVSETGDPDQVSRYLASQLDGLLGDSSLNISEGQYDQARGILGDNYNKTLQQYVDISDGTADTETAESFEAARDNTRSLITLREEFDRKLAAYEAAVAAGNTTRARELARELARLADQIDSVSVQLNKEYAEIENATGQNLEGQETIRLIQEETAEEAQTATDAQLTRTEIQAAFNTTQFSFTDPAQLTGQLRAVNGTPLSNRSVTLVVGTQEYTVTTTEAGNFSLTYQPISIPLTATTFPVDYVPADDSVYLGSNTTAAGTIATQTPTTLSASTTTSTIQYGTAVPITGTITIGDNASVGGLPVVATLSGEQVGTATTMDNGSFALTGSLPSPTVAPGTQTLRVSLPFENRSVAGATASVPVEITAAPTRLTLNATASESPTTTLRIQGALTLQTGEPVAGQPVNVIVNGRRVDSLRTTANGQYETTVQPAVADTPANATVSVQFEGETVALNSAEASTTIALSAASTSASSPISLLTSQPLLIGGGTAAGLVGLGFLVFSVRRRLPWLSDADSTPSTPDQSSSTQPTGSTATRSQHQVHSMLSAAEDALVSGEHTTAVQIAYSGLRSTLTEDVDATGDETHWEFYHQCQSSDVEAIPEIYDITTTYEVATFASQSVSHQDAEDAVTAVSAIVDAET